MLDDKLMDDATYPRWMKVARACPVCGKMVSDFGRSTHNLRRHHASHASIKKSKHDKVLK